MHISFVNHLVVVEVLRSFIEVKVALVYMIFMYVG